MEIEVPINITEFEIFKKLKGKDNYHLIHRVKGKPQSLYRIGVRCEIVDIIEKGNKKFVSISLM